MSRSVNFAVLVGNLTRDPEMKYTPKGTAVTTFGLATNRVYTTGDGEKKEEVDFHNVVAWGKLAEICNQYLRKGRQVYIRGRIRTSSWEGEDGKKRSRTEIVAEDMIMLGGRRVDDFGADVVPQEDSSGAETVPASEVKTNDPDASEPAPF